MYTNRNYFSHNRFSHCHLSLYQILMRIHFALRREGRFLKLEFIIEKVSGSRKRIVANGISGEAYKELLNERWG